MGMRNGRHATLITNLIMIQGLAWTEKDSSRDSGIGLLKSTKGAEKTSKFTSTASTFFEKEKFEMASVSRCKESSRKFEWIGVTTTCVSQSSISVDLISMNTTKM